MAVKSFDNAIADSEELPVAQSSNFKNGKFHNLKPPRSLTWPERLTLWRRFIFENPEGAEPEQPIPVVALTRRQLLELPDNTTSVIRLGHSSLLLKVNGEFWLTDPVFSERASPVAFAGPRRFHKPPIDIDELPDIRGVLISHNHYDHLDKAAIQSLHSKVEHFYVPLGVRADLVDWGVPESKATEFDWWQEQQLDEVSLIATPAQHFSGRGFGDGNETLWCSWVLRANEKRIFYSGDSGYFEGFRQIGDRYGPFDLTLLETGAYDKSWPGVHMQPEETLQAHLDLRGRFLMPVHNSTFRLAFHPWQEPLERISRIAAEHRVPLLTPKIGEVVSLGDDYPETSLWWRNPLVTDSAR